MDSSLQRAFKDQIWQNLAKMVNKIFIDPQSPFNGVSTLSKPAASVFRILFISLVKVCPQRASELRHSTQKSQYLDIFDNFCP